VTRPSTTALSATALLLCLGCGKPFDKGCFAFNAIIDYNAAGIWGKKRIAMAMLTIRNLDPALKERLRVRAATHGHSMEAEVRDILRNTLKEPEQPPAMNLYQRIRARFAPLGGVGLDLPPREPAPEPPRFD
jgi:plasmid stability protein